MSEQINKVLASTAQAFTTAEQKQARDNIGAQASGDYVSASTFSAFSAHVESAKLDASASGQFQPSGNYQTAGDYAYNSAVSAKQDSSAMSSYVPFSAISADSDSAITSINGSSVGKFTGVSAGNCISGDGTSGSPLGISATAKWTAGGNWYPMTEISAGYLKISSQAFAGAQIYQDESSLCNWAPTGITVRHSASSIGGGYVDNFYGETLKLTYNAGEYYLRQISSDVSGLHCQQNGNPDNESIFGFGSAAFSDDNGATWEVVDPASIRRWNSGVSAAWNESANSLSTGFGGNQATAASQFNDGAGNWTCRRVKCQGVPDQNLYGFQSKPNGTGTAYMVNPAGAFIQYQSNYFCYLYHKTGAVYDDLDTSFYPTGLTANARLDFVNLCSAASANIKTDTFHGNTAIMNPGDSATMWYIASADVWTDGNNDVPV